MSPEQQRLSQLISGIATALFALVVALSEKTVLQLEDYRATLHRLWDEMPADDAGGGAGFVFERLIDLLNQEVERRKQQGSE
jgi:hypothetical protein